MASTSPNQEPEGKQAKTVPRAAPLGSSAKGRPLPQTKLIPQRQAAKPPQVVVTSAAKELVDQNTADLLTTKLLDYSPPWLFSLAFHMLMLIVMGLMVYAVNRPHKPIQLNADTVYAEKLGSQLEFDSPLGVPNVKTAAEEAVLTPDHLPPVEDPFAAPSSLEIQPSGRLISSDI